MDFTPVPPALYPFLSDIRHCQVKDLHEAVIRREYGLAFSYLAQLAVEVFNHIGGIYKGSNLLRILEIGG